MPQIIIPEGATLSELASKYNTTIEELMKLNPSITDPDVIKAGAGLIVPQAPAPTRAEESVSDTEEEVAKEVTVIGGDEARNQIEEDKKKLATLSSGEPVYEYSQLREGATRKTPSGETEYFSVKYGWLPEEKYKGMKEYILSREEKEVLGEEEEEEEPPEISALKDQINDLNNDLNDTMGKLDDLRTSIEDGTKNLIDSIRKMYDQKRKMLQDANQRILASVKKLGIRMGTARYAPLIQTGIISAEEKAGISRLAELDAEESRLIADAQLALNSQQYDILHEKILAIQKRRDEKTEELKELMESIRKKNEELEEQKEKVSRQGMIINLYEQGVTDPNDIFNMLNFDAERNQIRNVEMGEITDVIEAIEEKEEKETQVVEIMKNGEPHKVLINKKTGEEIADLGEGEVDTQVIEVGGRKVLINKATGEIIKELGETTETADWNWARELIDLNPDASYIELYNAIRENTKLEVSDVKSLLEEAGKEPEKEAEVYLSDKQLREIAMSLLISYGNKEDTIRAIEHGVINLNKKMVDISPEQQEKIKNIIETDETVRQIAENPTEYHIDKDEKGNITKIVRERKWMPDEKIYDFTE